MPNYITGEAPQLQGHGKVRYRIAKNEHGLYLEITGSTEGGTSSEKAIYLGDLFDCIAEVEGHFESKNLDAVIGSSNNNDAGFVVAILKHIRFVQCTDVRDKYSFAQGDHRGGLARLP